MFVVAALKRLTQKSKAKPASAGRAEPGWPAGAWVALCGSDATTLRRAMRGPRPLASSVGVAHDPRRCLHVVLDVWGRPPPRGLGSAMGGREAAWLWARGEGPILALALLERLVALPSVRCVVLRDAGELRALPALAGGSRAAIPALLQRCRHTGVSIVATFVAPRLLGGVGVWPPQLTLGRGLVRQFVAWSSVRAQT